MVKKILFDKEAREKIKKGVNIVADAVSSTLGPRGQNVIFEETTYPTITKDGVTVAQQIFLEDKFENMGNMIAREAAENTNREAGDATTSTIVLLREIFNEGYKAVMAGMNPILLKRGLDAALQDVLKSLDKQAKKIKTDKELRQVAVISANNDEKTGKIIAEVIKRVGSNGVVTVTHSYNSPETEVEYVKGLKIDSGYESHLFINDARRLAAVLENPEIIITTDRISLSSQLIPIIERCLQAGKRHMVLFADAIEGQAIAFLVQNHLQGKFTCVPVKMPSFGGYQRDMVYDLATATEANVLGDQDAKKLQDADLIDLGNAEQVIVGRKETIVSGTTGDVSERIKEVKALLKEEKDLFNREKLKQRLGRLTGTVANIRAGGASESEQMELRYRIEDAINATKSAIEEGIVEGGGVALLRASKDVTLEEKDIVAEYSMGKKIVQKALSAPLRKIVENGGLSGDAVAEKVLETGLGYNALTNQFENLFETGIIDPKKAVRYAITNAVATAGVLLTSNTAIAIKEKDDNNNK